jgi:hypothetical protein
MSFNSLAAKSVVLRIVGMMTVAAAALVSAGLTSEPVIRAQSAQRAAPSKARLNDEAAGINGIVEALISVYDQFDVVALGEMHDRRHDSDLRIALVRHPGFAKKVRTIVVEWGRTTEQATLDRYIRGENVSKAQFEQVWKKLSAGNIGDLVTENSIYTDFFAAVREVNSKLPAAEKIRVFGGDAGPTARDTGAVSILEKQALQKGGKALVIYGAAHFWRAVPGLGGISRRLDADYRGRTFVVIPVGGPTKAGPEDVVTKVADYRKLDRALKTQVRPVMVPLQRLPFRNFTAEEFLGGHVVSRRKGRWVSIFNGSTLTLGPMADALVYFGRP